MAFQVFDNPHTVAIGSVTLTGVVAISVNVSYAEIHASADEDTHESVARHGTASTRGTIQFVDPVEAESAKGLTGTLTFKWNEVKGAADKTVTIATASIGGYDANVTRDAASSASVPFIAEAAPSIA